MEAIMAQVQWFPGHMAKTIKQLEETIKVCDMVLEVCDARIPNSSRNPILDDLAQGKERIIVLNKADLADPNVTQAWLDYYAQDGQNAIAIDARNKNDIRALKKQINDQTKNIVEKAKARGRRNRPVRLLVAGVPNSGKSTLINTLIGKKKAQTANKPGVTRSLQWLKLEGQLQLLDSPGLLWPKLETRQEQISLGSCAAVRDDIMPREELAGELLLRLKDLYPEIMEIELGLHKPVDEAQKEVTEQERALLALTTVAERFHMTKQAGEADLLRTAQFVLKQFRDGVWGQLSLESPPGF